MDHLLHAPVTFRDIVEADLRRAARLVISAQDEIDPQLRIACADGDYAIAVTLPCDARAGGDVGPRLDVYGLEASVGIHTGG